MKYYLKIIFLFLLSIYSIGSAQINPGAAFIASGSSNLNNDNLWALFTNPAALNNIPKTAVGVYYSPAPFEMKELNNYYGAVITDLGFGKIAAGYKNYGFELYKENEFRIGYAYTYSNFQYGISAALKSLSIKHYGTNVNFNIDLGSNYKLNDFLSLTLVANNLLRNRKNELNYEPFIVRIGFTARPITNFILSGTIYKEDDFPLSLRGGIEYSILEIFTIRSGFISYPRIYSGGIGIRYSYFNLNYAVLIHQYLGITHQFDLIFLLDI